MPPLEEKVFSMLKSFGSGVTEHLLVTEKNSDNRENQLKEILAKKFKHYEVNAEYDYIIIDQIVSPTELFKVLKSHNEKLVVFNTEKVFARQTVKVLMGAICSSPDSGSKWSVSLDGQKNFSFFGHIIVLTELSKAVMKSKEKFHYLTRDMRII